MKSISKVATALLVSLGFTGLNAQEGATNLDAPLTGPVEETAARTAAPTPAPIHFEVVRSQTQKIDIENAPEMPGVPAPTGMIHLTVELVKPPTLGDPPPLPALTQKDPAAVSRMGELVKDDPETQLVFVSASVYQKTITQFRIQGIGQNAKEITGWSNIDFHLFSGSTNYQVTGADGVVREYGLVMSIEDMNGTEASVDIPKLPDLATQGPAFVLTGGDDTDLKTREIIDGIHNLYKAQGPQLVEAYRQRIKAYEERKADLLAKPPKPKDVTIRFWNREAAAAR